MYYDRDLDPVAKGERDEDVNEPDPDEGREDATGDLDYEIEYE